MSTEINIPKTILFIIPQIRVKILNRSKTWPPLIISNVQTAIKRIVVNALSFSLFYMGDELRAMFGHWQQYHHSWITFKLPFF